MTLQSTDNFLVCRDGTSYQTQAQNLMATIEDTDLMLVNRGGNSYKVTGAEVKAELGTNDGIYNGPIDDVFRVHGYTGNGTSQSFNLGLDLLGDGGMVIVKSIGNRGGHLATTAWGNNRYRMIESETNVVDAPNSITFTNVGFDINNTWNNSNLSPYVAYVWKVTPGFFDIVSYTGNDAKQTLTHNLGSLPAMVWISSDQRSPVTCIPCGITNYTSMQLNTSGGFSTNIGLDPKQATDTEFYIQSGGGTYSNLNGNRDFVAFFFSGSKSQNRPTKWGYYIPPKWEDNISYEIEGMGDRKPQFYMTVASHGFTSGIGIMDKISGMPSYPGSNGVERIHYLNAQNAETITGQMTISNDVVKNLSCRSYAVNGRGQNSTNAGNYYYMIGDV